MEFIRYGEKALLINFEQRIAPEINQEVIRLKNAIEQAKIAGLTFIIPAYCSLTVGYIPEKITFETLKTIITNLPLTFETGESQKSTILKIPVCYESSVAPDLEEVMLQTQLTAQEIITLHTSTLFQVYMMGFLPGFAYLGRLPQALACPRKASPRTVVPQGAVAIAGLQTGIYPFQSPGGWQIIGRTPLKIFDSAKENPFLFKVGDFVQFYAISLTTFEAMLFSDDLP